MVSAKSVREQLKSISFNYHAWGKAEVDELPNILLPDEKIFECVNGIYEGGFALLCATDVRLLLIDKKPFKFLTVEDLRFDMITEIDYSHRMFGASISVSSGSKNLRFRSYNQPRLRKLIGHVQHRMAESKQQQSQQADSQQQHLEQINQQLQAYLLAQYQQQETLRQQLQEVKARSGAEIPEIEPVRPGPQLSDYLFAQNLLKQYGQQPATTTSAGTPLPTYTPLLQQVPSAPVPDKPLLTDLYAEGMKEIFGKKQPSPAVASSPAQPADVAATISNPLEINPLKIAYSKLPMVLRNRKFGRSSFHGSRPAASKPLLAKS
jgi:hypothetical protein